jgi:hypothetical protein
MQMVEKNHFSLLDVLNLALNHFHLLEEELSFAFRSFTLNGVLQFLLDGLSLLVVGL